MTATELFSTGCLCEAIDAQLRKVKIAPADQPARLFLFELLAFAGDLERARRHLDLLRYDDPQHSAAIEQLRAAFNAEQQRRAVFAGTAQPKCIGVAPDHLQLRLEAIAHSARGEHADARRVLDEANAAVPALIGTRNGQPFTGFYDADERFGTVLEVFGPGGVYSWVPLELVESLTLNPPQSPRDILWRPAHLALRDGPSGDVLLPGLYPNTHEHADDEVKLGRATEWLGAEGEVVRGAGGRVFFSAGEMVRFVEVTSLEFNHAADSAETRATAEHH